MSIYSSLGAPSEDEHTDDCARWEKHDDCWEISDRPCDCGQPDAPLVYQGSHVLPSEDDARGGWVDIACISDHVRYWRDHPDAPVETEPEGHEPFLRFGVNEERVVLTRRNVKQIAATLDWWLRETQTKEERLKMNETDVINLANLRTARDLPEPTPEPTEFCHLDDGTGEAPICGAADGYGPITCDIEQDPHQNYPCAVCGRQLCPDCIRIEEGRPAFERLPNG